MKVLLAEDNPEIQQIFSELLKLHGYDVTVCGDGKTALALLKTKKYGMLITDNDMPNLSGIKVLEQSTSIKIPKLLITSGWSPSLQKKAEGYGAFCRSKEPENLIEFLDDYQHNNSIDDG
jgi:CheY-like chemotaxis protein